LLVEARKLGNKVNIAQFVESVRVTRGDKTCDVKTGAFIRLKIPGESGSRRTDFYIAKVVFMFRLEDDESGEILFHGVRFVHGEETIVGEPLNSSEVFATRQCWMSNFAGFQDVIQVIIMRILDSLMTSAIPVSTSKTFALSTLDTPFCGLKGALLTLD
jgi:hypothetical protein